MAARKTKASVMTYGDHEMIVPDENLRAAVLKGDPLPGEEDPVGRAEKALANLAGEFAAWMNTECDRLDRARRDIARTASARKTRMRCFMRRTT